MQKTFVDVGDVTLHVRSAGAGAPLVLIHQAPISARTLESRIERLSKDFFCIAPDLPGLGQSDTLGGGLVSVERMAETMLGLLQTLGIERAVIYGQHTGALVATEIAIRRPDMVAGVLIGGYPIYTSEESAQRVTTYAPELPAPTWDGGHLSWLWYRYREQFVHWPWNTKEPRTRATCAIPSKEFLQEGVAEIASRYDSYAEIYHAAFEYDAEEALRLVKVPVHFILDLADSLSLKIELAAAANPSLHRWPGPTAEIEAIEHTVALQAAQGLAPAASGAMEAARSTRRIACDWNGGAAEIWVQVATPGAPLTILLPPFPAGPRAILPEVQDVAGRSFIAVEITRLPIAGDQAAWLTGFADAISGMLATLQPGSVSVVSAGGASVLAMALSAHLDGIDQTLALDPDDRGDGSPFDPAICASGGHLLRLWDRLRFERMRPPTATPEDGASVRGRYENIDLLGRYSWDAVSRMALLPAWDELVASQKEQEAAFLASAKVRIIVTGVDKRGRIDSGFGSGAGVTHIRGTVAEPFREAIALLGREPR